MKHVMLRFTGPLPDLDRIYPADLALPSDAQYLRDNPEAIARVRSFRDETRTDRRVVLLAVRVLDPTQPDGWRTAYCEGHSAHCHGLPHELWSNDPTFWNANRLAMTTLTADADTDGGNPATILPLLIVPAAAHEHMDPYWQRQFAPVGGEE